jgi:hypothetical protein
MTDAADGALAAYSMQVRAVLTVLHLTGQRKLEKTSACGMAYGEASGIAAWAGFRAMGKVRWRGLKAWGR